MPECISAVHPFDHGTKVTLLWEGNMLGIIIEPHKGVAQFLPEAVSRASFFATSSREEMQAWHEHAHTTVSPNAISIAIVLLGNIRRNAKSLQNFLASPYAPAQERDENSGWVIRVTWNCFKRGQMLWHCQSTWEGSSHWPGSLTKMPNCSSLIVSTIEENQLVGRW